MKRIAIKGKSVKSVVRDKSYEELEMKLHMQLCHHNHTDWCGYLYDVEQGEMTDDRRRERDRLDILLGRYGQKIVGEILGMLEEWGKGLSGGGYWR